MCMADWSDYYPDQQVECSWSVVPYDILGYSRHGCSKKNVWDMLGTSRYFKYGSMGPGMCMADWSDY